MSLCVCAAEELNTLKGIEGESPEDKPPQQQVKLKEDSTVEAVNVFHFDYHFSTTYLIIVQLINQMDNEKQCVVCFCQTRLVKVLFSAHFYRKKKNLYDTVDFFFFNVRLMKSTQPS